MTSPTLILLLALLTTITALAPPDVFKAGISSPKGLASKFAKEKILSIQACGFPSKSGVVTKASPRHCKYAWGGIKEPAVQNKPLPNKLTVDPWIDFEMFLRAKSVESVAKKYSKDFSEEEIVAGLEAVFVSLAGGSKWLTRAKAESSLAVIESQGFDAAMKKGRIEFALGWASFLFLTVGFASCIVVPTNPAAKALEGLVELARVKGGFEYVAQI
ncbi:hypothetical protein TrRE_jg2216 [Triparma retinervis]|uniref:Uncharacterized protein n=1 Tax=Triparma retinervis TaxID=2557542 RepID=A0A9W6ZTF3_9STRA|nr:hypothetical protein TrRE_jg2216 [Triparma retinervis]